MSKQKPPQPGSDPVLSGTRKTVSNAIQRVITFQQIVVSTMRELAPVFADSQVGLAMLSPDREQLEPVWCSDSAQDFFLNREGALWDLAERAFESGKARKGAGTFKIIHQGDKAVGVLVSGNSSTFSDDLLTAVAEELSEAARQLEEISEVQQLSRKMQILNSVAKSLSTALEMDIILTATMQAVWEMFYVEAGALVLREDSESWNLTKYLLTGQLSESQFISGDQPGGIVGHCILNSATAFLENAPDHLHYDPAVDDIEGYGTRSMLVVPLLVREKVFGAIELINKIDTHFNRSDMELLITLASNVAAAINNVQLFRSLSQVNKDLEASKEEISRSRSTLMALFDNLDDELYIVDRNFHIAAINQTRARRSKKNPQDVIGKECYQSLFDRDGPCEECRAMETFTTGEKTKRLEREWDSPQIEVEREIYTYPIKDPAGNVMRTILQVRDITEQRRLEASLIQAEKLAAVGQLAAGVAHELNNPITAVIANVQLMRLEMAQKLDQTESLELIESASLRAQEVVKGLLNFSRQERQEFVLMDINTSIRQSLALVQNQWSSSNVHLVLDLGDHLPAVRGNPDHLQSVWLNLLINAYDALDDKGGAITVRSRVQDEGIEVLISDTGMGIEPDLIKKIFEPFFTTKEPGKGTGLGLSTTYRIVKQHGGDIDIKSQPNQGTRMVVVLPTVPTAE